MAVLGFPGLYSSGTKREGKNAKPNSTSSVSGSYRSLLGSSRVLGGSAGTTATIPAWSNLDSSASSGRAATIPAWSNLNISTSQGYGKVRGRGPAAGGKGALALRGSAGRNVKLYGNVSPRPNDSR